MLISRVFISTLFILGVLVIWEFVSRLFVIMLLNASRYTYNYHESWNWGNLTLDQKLEQQPVDGHRTRASFGIVYDGIFVKRVVAEGLVLEAVDNNGDDIPKEIALTEQVISVVYLVCCPIMLIFKDKCLLIFYYKYFQSF